MHIHAKTIRVAENKEAFRQDLRSLARALWIGLVGVEEFTGRMFTLTNDYFSEAFFAGAKTVGIEPSELTFEEQLALRGLLTRQHPYIQGLAFWIWDNRKEADGVWGHVVNRLSLWVNTYVDFKNQGAAIAARDLKLEWRLHEVRKTDKPCDDCLNLAGRIYRASTWRRWGIYPQSRALKCGGWLCGCGFVPTKDRATPGRPPKLTYQ